MILYSLYTGGGGCRKIKTSITRKDVAIRDYYDLWYIAGSGFDFYLDKFIKLFKKKLAEEVYTGDFSQNFGLNQNKIAILRRQVETDLMLVVRSGEKFNLDKVFDRFNQILSDKR